MKKCFQSSAVLMALTSHASAADLPSHKAQVPILAAVSQWQGIYAGINAGYGLNNINTSYSDFGYQQADASIIAGRYNVVQNVAGGVAGGQIGYNHVFSNHWMGGAEVDFNWADIYNTNNGESNTPQLNGFNLRGGATSQRVNIENYYNRLGLNWYGTVRARIGYDLGRFLPYITAGLAYGGLSNHFTYANINSDTIQYGNVSTGSSSTVGIGWAAGAGAEYMVADNWSLKGEYVYTSIGGITTPGYTFGADTIVGVTQGIAGNVSTGAFGVHQVRAGLNYHTNWLTDAPIAAKF